MHEFTEVKAIDILAGGVFIAITLSDLQHRSERVS
jgi:hypothetical protein